MGKVVFITGMHRSGTSLFTSYLGECGGGLGDALLSPDLGNKHGYYEDRDVVEFNNKLLAKNNYDYWVRKCPQIKYRSEDVLIAQSILRNLKSNTGGKVLLIKDPRISLLLDFWHEVEPDAFFIFLHRTPLKVIDSLYKRNSDPIIKKRFYYTFTSWIIYNLRILNFFKHTKQFCMCVSIEKFLRRPNEYVKALNKSFELNLRENVEIESVYHKESFGHNRYDFRTWVVIIGFPIRFYMGRIRVRLNSISKDL